MKFQFFAHEITYKVVDDKPVVFLHGKTKDGKKITVVDKKFKPYFYVQAKTKELQKKIIEKVTSLEAEEKGITAKVEEAKIITKNIISTPKELIQVFTNIPKAVPIIREIVKEWDDVEETYEYDILFVRKFLIDKQLTPLTLLEVEGEKQTLEEQEVIEATAITQSNDDTIIKPKIVALDIETYDANGDVDMDKNPILMIGLYAENYEKVITWKEFKNGQSYIQFVKSEKEMLEAFKDELNKFQPDILTGYFTDGFDLPYIAKRAQKLKVDIPGLRVMGTKFKEVRLEGISHLDLIKFVRNTIGRTMKTDSYSLDNVAKEILGEQKHEVNISLLSNAWDENDDKELEKFAEYNLQDCKLTFDLFMSLFPQMLELIKIVGLNPADTIRMTVSQLLEAYIMRHASPRDEVALNKPGYRETQRRLTNPIKGAFVFTPKPGLYEDIAVFDFRSLYPSIISSHNISLETLRHGTSENQAPIEGEEIYFDDKSKGFISQLIGDILKKRIEINKLLKEEQDKTTKLILKARSQSLKLLANSFYGYLAFSKARWYSRDCASATTAWARHYIHDVIDKAKEEGFDVLYGDTDSVFLHLKNKTKEEATTFAQEVNKTLPGLMELEFEGYHPTGIFVAMKGREGGAKKKYALLNENDSITIKGFESVRRNWSPIAKDVQEHVLQLVLKERDPDKAVEHVKEIIKKLGKHEIPVEKVTIRTQLQKAVASYDAIGPHVRAAIRMKDRGEKIRPGSIIRYVIIKGKGRIGDRARLPDEEDAKHYDADYYIKNQVIPAVSSIFEAFGIDTIQFEQKEQSSLSSFF